MNSEDKAPRPVSPGRPGESSPGGLRLQAGMRRRNPIQTGIVVLSAGTCLMAVMAILAPAFVRAHLAATKNQTPTGRPDVLASNSTPSSKAGAAKTKSTPTPVVAVAVQKTETRNNSSQDKDSIVELVVPPGLDESNEPPLADENLPLDVRLTELKRRVERIGATEATRQKNAVDQGAKSLRELQQILHETEDVLDAMAAPAK